MFAFATTANDILRADRAWEYLPSLAAQSGILARGSPYSATLHTGYVRTFGMKGTMMDETTESTQRTRSPFGAIRAIDYTVIFVRDMAAMRRFYEEVLAFPLLRELSPNWIEYGLGSNTLALAKPGRTATDPPIPHGSAAPQLAFKVSAAEVDACAGEL